MTVEAKSGYTLQSVTLTYAVKNTGVFVYDGSNVTSGSAVTVSGSSAEFSVGNTGTATKGQVALSEISVTYESTGGDDPDPAYYSLTLPTVTGGSVTANVQDLTSIEEGTSVTVTATPESGYALDWMKANGVEVSNPYTFNINANTVITASFSQPTYGDVTFEGGVDIGSSSGQNEDQLNKNGVTLHFSKAYTSSGAYRIYSGSTTTISVAQGYITKVVFTPNGSYDPSLLSLAEGQPGAYSDGTWTGNAQSVAFTASAQFRADAITVTVSESPVELNYYSLTLPTVTGGSVTANVNDPTSIQEGTEVTVTATPESGYELEWLKANGIEVENPYTFNISEDVVITASFVESQEPTYYSLTLPTGLTGGTVTANVADPSAIEEGTSVTVTATAESGYELDWMKANGSEVSNPYTFNISENVEITAAFKETSVDPGENAQPGESVIFEYGTGKEFAQNNGEVMENSVKKGITIAFAKSTGNNDPKWYTSSNGNARVYNGNTITVTAPSKIETVTFTYDGSYALSNPNPEPGSFSDGVWTVGDVEGVLKSTNTSRISTITVKLAAEGALDLPVISGNNPFVGSTEVTITNPNESGTIYYTTDGGDPSAEDAIYAGPFTITETTTVKAIVVDGNNISGVAQMTFDAVPAVDNIAEFTESDGSVVAFANPVTVLGQNGQYLYVQDGSDAGMIIYGSVGQTYTFGDIIPAGFSGKYTLFRGMHEMTNPSGLEPKSGNQAPSAIEVTVDGITTANSGRYAVIKGATISGNTIVVGDNSVALYDRFGWTAPDDLTKTYDIYGVTSMYASNNTATPYAQFLPLDFVDATPTAYTITLAEVENGTLDCTDTEAEEGTEIMFQALPDAGYRIVGMPTVTPENIDLLVEVTDEGDGYYSFYMPAANVTISAEFEAIPVYSITIEDLEGGSIECTDDEAQEGQQIIFSVTPDNHWNLSGMPWVNPETLELLVEVTDEGDGYYSFIMPADNVTIGAAFEAEATHFVTVEENLGGTVSLLEPDVYEFFAGDDVYFTVTPDEHFSIATEGISVTDQQGEPVEFTDLGDNQYGFTMPENDVNISVIFEQTEFQIRFAYAENVTVVGLSDGEYAYVDNDVLFSVTANEGYVLNGLTITADETPIDFEQADDMYSFTMPAEDVVITFDVSEEVEPVAPLWVIGNVVGTGWQTDSGIEMPFNAENNQYEVTITVQGSDGIGYFGIGTVLANNWSDFNAGRLTGAESGNFVVTADNHESIALMKGHDSSFQIADGEYTLIIDAEQTTLQILGDFPVTQEAYYLIGSFNGWNESEQAMTPFVLDENDGYYYATQAMGVGAEFKMKDGNGTWYGAQSGDNFIVTQAQVEGGTQIQMLEGAGNNLQMTVAGQWTFTYMPVEKKLIISGTWPVEMTFAEALAEAQDGDVVQISNAIAISDYMIADEESSIHFVTDNEGGYAMLYGGNDVEVPESGLAAGFVATFHNVEGLPQFELTYGEPASMEYTVEKLSLIQQNADVYRPLSIQVHEISGFFQMRDGQPMLSQYRGTNGEVGATRNLDFSAVDLDLDNFTVAEPYTFTVVSMPKRSVSEPAPVNGRHTLDAPEFLVDYELLVVSDNVVVITGIDNIFSKVADAKAVRYYNLQGVESSKPFDGINIVVIEHNDGTRTVQKAMMK